MTLNPSLPLPQGLTVISLVKESKFQTRYVLYVYYTKGFVICQAQSGIFSSFSGKSRRLVKPYLADDHWCFILFTLNYTESVKWTNISRWYERVYGEVDT